MGLVSSPLASVKPQVPAGKRLRSSCELIPWEGGSVRGVPKAAPGFVAAVGHLGTGEGRLRECGDSGALNSPSIRECFPLAQIDPGHKKWLEYVERLHIYSYFLKKNFEKYQVKKAWKSGTDIWGCQRNYKVYRTIKDF